MYLFNYSIASQKNHKVYTQLYFVATLALVITFLGMVVANLFKVEFWGCLAAICICLKIIGKTNCQFYVHFSKIAKLKELTLLVMNKKIFWITHMIVSIGDSKVLNSWQSLVCWFWFRLINLTLVLLFKDWLHVILSKAKDIYSLHCPIWLKIET